jgi:hypothetical protein
MVKKRDHEYLYVSRSFFCKKMNVKLIVATFNNKSKTENYLVSNVSVPLYIITTVWRKLNLFNSPSNSRKTWKSRAQSWFLRYLFRILLHVKLLVFNLRIYGSSCFSMYSKHVFTSLMLVKNINKFKFAVKKNCCYGKLCYNETLGKGLIAFFKQGYFVLKKFCL